MNAPVIFSKAVLADSLARHSPQPAPWHRTPAARAAIAAVVLADERPIGHRTTYALTADEWHSYEGPLAGKVCALWAAAYEVADAAYLEGDRDALNVFFAQPRLDAAIDAAFARRDDAALRSAGK
ncbi:hypothetical protein GCM10008023_05650 [Sphingomonas glacialis]|uniref:Uncharacterized protein n=1 Tax=Sphingomonas glacialis TaxID=658225 RepID=A0ABQ3LD28_9SPHN|nr:hypothetical protein [Sphingomonas glacialis]GHH09242.1 hypothetical protein GCM10008023_05650 [Sphingomonas glacialis]